MNSRNIRDDYFLALRAAWKDFPKTYASMAKVENHQLNTEEFYRWCEDKWGVEVLQSDGGISENYKVVDDAKFMLFKLKYYSRV